MKFFYLMVFMCISVELHAQTEPVETTPNAVEKAQLSSAELEQLLKETKLKELAEKQAAVLAAKKTINENSVSAEGIKNWGLGFGLGVEQFRDEFVDKASVQGQNKIVVLEKTYETLPSAWLTLNWNVIGLDSTRGKDFDGNDVHNVKFGFYAGVKILGTGADEAFSAFSLGPQISFVTNEKIISIGAGWVTHGTQDFANGIVEGNPLPDQYQEIVFRQSTENSYMIMMSVGL
jgi:hypothetical protein